jgi:hypothetical protein
MLHFLQVLKISFKLMINSYTTKLNASRFLYSFFQKNWRDSFFLSLSYFLSKILSKRRCQRFFLLFI